MTLALATAGFAASTKDSVPLKAPTLTIDNSPVADAKAPVVTSYADVIEPVQKAVVSVHSAKIVRERLPVNPLYRQFFGDQLPERESKEQGLGSGVIVSPDGYILTNNHVIEGADELNVSLPDDREFKAKVIGADPKTDIAVIKIDAQNLPTLPLANSDKLRVGDIVFAVGNPLGIGQTVTMGIVSAKGRNNLGLLDGVNGYENFIQTDAAINVGNSGGALVDAKGRLVGINSAIVSTSRGNIGIGLAIPVNLAAGIMHSLVESGSVTRGYLGVSVDPVTPETAATFNLKKDAKAVIVTAVNPGSPAEKSGLKRYDAILSINDTPVTSVQDLRLLVSQLAPSTEISIKLLRDDKEVIIKVKLGLLADDSAQNEILPGVEVSQLSDELRRRFRINGEIDGLIVTEVAGDSPYANRIAPGMAVIEINRHPVTDIESARRLFLPGRNLLLIYSRGTYRYLAVTRDQR